MKLSWSLSVGLWSCLTSTVLASSEPSSLGERAVVDASLADTFQYDKDGVNFTFTFTANANGDIWFSMAAPNKFSWMAVGTGSKMKGSLMFVAYGDGTASGMTLSGRFGTGNVEPTYSDTIGLSTVTPPSGPTNINEDGMLFVSGTCTNCTNLAESTIDLTSTAQPFIFAVGDVDRFPATTSKSGPLRSHPYYGYFTMDLTKATNSSGGGPISLHSEIENAQLTRFLVDHDIVDPLHAFVMVIAFLVIFPLGVLSLRVLNNIKLHMIFQSIGLALGIIGAACGFYLTTIYNRSKNFNSAHQIIGLLVVIALISQWVGGFLHHRYYVKNRRPWMNGVPIKGHKMVLGPIILLGGLVDAGIGFNLALAHRWNYVYVPLAIAMVVVVTAIIFMREVISRRIMRRRQQNPIIGVPQAQPFGQGPPAGGFGGNYATTTRSDIALNRMPSNNLSSYSLDPVKTRDTNQWGGLN